MVDHSKRFRFSGDRTKPTNKIIGNRCSYRMVGISCTWRQKLPKGLQSKLISVILFRFTINSTFIEKEPVTTISQKEYHHFIFDNSTNPNGPHQCLLLNDSVSLVSRCRVCRKFTWTLYIQYSYRLFDFPSTIDAICHQYHTLVFFPSTSFYFSLIQQLVLESQHKKRCDQMMSQ